MKHEDVIGIGIYVLGVIAAAYVMGRKGWSDSAPFALIWPLLVVTLPIMAILFIANIGERHR